MYIQVRTIDGKRKVTISMSKAAKIADLKSNVATELDVPVENQRLFFRGKQLEDDHTLFDYGVNLNDVVQLMIKQDILNDNFKDEPLKENTNESSVNSSPEENTEVEEPDGKVWQDDYYRVGDTVDYKSEGDSWFEGFIREIILSDSPDDSRSNSYKIKCLRDSGPDIEVKFIHIRPRPHVLIPLKDLKKGQVIMANYNLNSEEDPGFWYTCHVKTVSASAKNPKLVVTVELGRENITKVDDCKIKFTDLIFKLEEPKLLTERTQIDEEICSGLRNPDRNIDVPFCDLCNDAPVKKCVECGCQKCHKKNNPDKTILCDECDDAYHIYCLNPPLAEVPESDDWYCPECKIDDNEIVKAGEKLKYSKKKAQMASNVKGTKSSRDWGKGMACVGRTTECTIVPLNHFGPVPGIEVGTTWKFRLQASEAGIHRPHVAGIHGRENEGAYSIVLSGGYEDDVDNGETFLFSGSGGRDLSGNKRTAEQSIDQELTRNNLALARNCNAPVNNKVGATAKDWKDGLPVRVVRNYKLAKHSKYAPKDGNRYDGIYKVVKYYPEKGKSGFLVWRYMLRRDDPTPAPWTPAGKKLIAAQGLDTVLLPDGYEEAEKKAKTPAKKRSLPDDTPGTSGTQDPPKKKLKTIAYKLPAKLKNIIKKDTNNSKLWESVLSKLDKGKQEFLSEVQNAFVCICCLELVDKPITTDCKHNFCKVCLARSFNAEVYTCAHCRNDLGEDYEMIVNDELQAVLIELFPGYNSKR